MPTAVQDLFFVGLFGWWLGTVGMSVLAEYLRHLVTLLLFDEPRLGACSSLPFSSEVGVVALGERYVIDVRLGLL